MDLDFNVNNGLLKTFQKETFQEENLETYVNNNKKIFIYELNNTQSKKTNAQIDKYKDDDTDDDIDDDIDDDTDEKTITKAKCSIENVEDKDNKNDKNDEEEKIQILHLCVQHLDLNDNWVENSDKHWGSNSNYTIGWLKDNFIKQINPKFSSKFSVVSETGKINLTQAYLNSDTKKYVSSSLLDKILVQDGMTGIKILCNEHLVRVEKILLKAKALNKISDNLIANPIANLIANPNLYRNIEWDLEFEETSGGYEILGLDNFIHLSLVGLENIQIDVIYLLNNEHTNTNTNLPVDFPQLELKFSRCVYNDVIKENLKKFLYENEESYSVDLIDYLEKIGINIDQEEKMFGSIYGTNYNILRIMSGLGGIAYSN